MGKYLIIVNNYLNEINFFNTRKILKRAIKGTMIQKIKEKKDTQKKTKT